MEGLRNEVTFLRASPQPAQWVEQCSQADQAILNERVDSGFWVSYF